MTEATLNALTFALAGFAAIVTVTLAALAGWRGWLDLKRAEVAQSRADPVPPSAGARIEIADLKERIRKLEAIAAGVEL